MEKQTKPLPKGKNIGPKKPKKKRRKLKKKVKRVLLLILACICLLIGFSVKNHLHQRQIEAQQQEKILKKKAKAKQEKAKQLAFEKKNPQRTYGEKTRKKLAKESLNSYLILQTDERWAKKKYGWGEDTTFAKNGCAIASLAMIESYWQKKLINPTTVLSWAKDDYYTDQGTSWAIFPQYAQQNNYQYLDLSDRIQNALPYLKKGIPVLISVNPGKFTPNGHIMVLSAYNGKKIRLLDPNDDAKKKHSLTWFTPEELQNEVAHLWVLYK
ncbi:C39 family peptidase [Enterococcus cecorum]|uniref:C39 family peptidase n=1 Tax=Enterococcus cecorum TaxID=44008 RepID=UPI0025A3AEFF|nr:C39 family peptidase [Enterococcus cecorum]MDM8183283.1 C39 family peptidase [Enterococcus cecorum]